MSTDRSTYDPSYFPKLFAIEQQHFWFRARKYVISEIVKRIIPNKEQRSYILEVGCGTGNILHALEASCPQSIILGMDLFNEGLTYAGKRTSCQLIQADVHQPPLGASFDIVGLFDVLEHLPNDRETLMQLRKLLAPGGSLVLTVPAHMSLWSYFDEVSHHCRRYTVKELSHKLLEAGYEIQFISYYMSILFPLIWVGRRTAQLFESATKAQSSTNDELAAREFKIIPLLNNALFWLLSIEAHFLTRKRHLPIGTSVLVVAKARS